MRDRSKARRASPESGSSPLARLTRRMSTSAQLRSPEGPTVLPLAALAEGGSPVGRLSLSVPRSRVSETERSERVEISTPPAIRSRSSRSSDAQEKEEFDAHLQSLVERVRFPGLLRLRLRAKFARRMVKLHNEPGMDAATASQGRCGAPD